MSKLNSLFALVLSSAVALSSVARADVAGNRDAELMAALRKINARRAPMSLAVYNAVDWQLNGGLAIVAGLTGGGIAAVLKYVPLEEIAAGTKISVETLQKTKAFLKRNGFDAALAVGGFVVVANAIANVYLERHDHDARQLRLAAIHAPNVYRTQLAHFLALDLREQYLIARADTDLTRDIITLAENLPK